MSSPLYKFTSPGTSPTEYRPRAGVCRPIALHVGSVGMEGRRGGGASADSNAGGGGVYCIELDAWFWRPDPYRVSTGEVPCSRAPVVASAS